MSRLRKDAPKTPEQKRQKHLRRMERLVNDPEYRARVTRQNSAWYARPENKEKKKLYNRNRREKSGLIVKKQKGFEQIPVRSLTCDVCDYLCKTVLDHDHVTGQFRGWLCEHCNWALGQVKDNPNTLRMLADYLDRFSELRVKRSGRDILYVATFPPH